MTRQSTLDLLLIGNARPLPPDGQQSGIFKQPVARAILRADGFIGDCQADRRFHGGSEKAVHLYPPEHYPALATTFTAAQALLSPGVLGENLSAAGLTEDVVHIGDVFALGQTRIQVSAPRSPCWKINHRLEVSGASQWISDQGRTGWYARVLQGGEVRQGDAIVLLERVSTVALAAFWQLATRHRPDPEQLLAAALASGLDPAWRHKLEQRSAWLRAQANGARAH